MAKYDHIPSIPQATAAILALARTRVKSAELGGGQDMPFEQAFSNIAHAYLKDKAPSLLDYEVGFQLVDKNQENTKAIGVLAFKAGPQWIYGPVFFLNGAVKGHEMMYLKDQDRFVPMNEDWVNDILHHKPSVMGEGISRNLSDVGVLPPHLYQLSRSPSKFASAVEKLEDWERDSLCAMSYWGTVSPASDPKYADVVSLPAFLKEAGVQTLVALFKTFEQYPQVKEAFDQFYDLSVVADAVKEAKARYAAETDNSVLTKNATCRMTPNGIRCTEPGKKPAIPAPAKSVVDTAEVTNQAGTQIDTDVDDGIKNAAELKVTLYDDVMHAGNMFKRDLSDDERKKLVREKVLFEDKRKDSAVSHMYEVQTQLKLFTPDETGLYDVLVKPNEFVKCLVVMAPYSDRRRETFCTVIRLEGGKGWMNIHPSHVHCCERYKGSEFKKWFAEQKNATPKKDGLYMVVAEDGESSCPFSISDTVVSGEHKTYRARFRDYARQDRAGWLPKLKEPSYSDWRDYGGGPSHIAFTGRKGGKLKCTGNFLNVPDGFKVIKLKDPPKKKDGYVSFECDSSNPAPFVLGTLDDIEHLIGMKTASMKLAAAGSEIIINNQRMTKLAGLVHLVRDHGLREKQARAVIARTEAEKVLRCRVKYADQYYDMQRRGPSSPTFPEPYVGFDPMSGGRYPTIEPSEFDVKVPDMSSSNTDRSVYYPMGPEPDFQQPADPDRKAQQAALSASQTGQREIIDTSMIAGLLKAVHDDDLVDKHLPAILKGLDRIFRILFCFYWHNEKFAERYGQQDMVKLEDGLRNSAEAVGDIALFLKQRVANPHSSALNGVDLGDVSDS